MSQYYAATVERLSRFDQMMRNDRYTVMRRMFFKLAEEHPALFSRLFDYGMVDDRTEKALGEIRQLLKDDQFLPAIKHHRRVFDTSLKEAKEAVEEIRNNL